MLKNTEPSTRATQKRLAKASEYVNDLWFPVNSELLAKIKLGIRGGIYELDPESLVNSISSDFSLFMYCLRELITLLKKEDITLPLSNPIEALRQAGIDRLKQILEVDEQKISKHSYEGADKFQALRFEEMMISASAAQAISTSVNIDQEVGFSAAILRQLGHTLIAWNYPTVYKNALECVTEDISIDQLIAEKLGFSPTLLSIRVLMDWGMPVAMCEALFLEEDDIEEKELEGQIQTILGGNLAKICAVGEALARANNPEIYPSAEKDWELAKSEISSHLGETGLQYIQEVLQENLEAYMTFMPEIFKPGLILDPGLRIALKNDKLAPVLNPYIQLCSERVQQSLNAIYALIEPNAVSEKNLSKLINEVIPTSGFTGGLVFTVDPGISMLVPQSVIATPKLKAKKSVDYSLIVSNADSVSVAYHSPEPVIEFRTTSDEEVYTGISGIIGNSNRVGVLYLEIPYNQFIQDERALTMAFRAFSRTITDCLDLK